MRTKVHHCQVCKVARRFTYLMSVDTDGLRITQIWSCSKGHWHNVERITSKMVNHLLKVIYLPGLQEMFNRPSVLSVWLNARG